MTRRVLAVADSDSYVKWAAATLDRLDDVDASLVVLDSPVRPSPAQVHAAVAATVSGIRLFHEPSRGLPGSSRLPSSMGTPRTCLSRSWVTASFLSHLHRYKNP